MKIKKISWQFFLVCFGMTAFALGYTTWYAVHITKQLYLQTAIDGVKKRSFLVSMSIGPALKNGNAHSVDSLCKYIGKKIQTRITVVMPSGKVIGDSEADPDTMESHENRPEIITALMGDTGVETRFSATLNQWMLYIACPLKEGNETKGALRLSVSIARLQVEEQGFYFKILVTSLILFVLMGFASLMLSQQLSKPILEMKNGAQRFSRGELDFKLPVPKGEELGELAAALNSMALSLNDRIKIITQQRNELDAVLTSMNEGVIAVDKEENIMSLNPAGANMLGINEKNAKGKPLNVLIRNSALQKFMHQVLIDTEKKESTFILSTPDGDVNIQAYGIALNSVNGQEGAVIVLNDITRLRRLENLRKEFVANVSHELRTPLTSIKGFVETIQNGNYQLPDEVLHFLDIINNRTDRLCSIVDDILTLSSIERDSEQKEVTFAYVNVKTILKDAVDTCRSKAENKNIALQLSCDETLKASVNAPLLEQAIVNLIDNAIKYSDTDKAVSITAEKKRVEIVISVSDQGIGIPQEHVDRVFERFYRVDKARSRKLGGTGLGLSIVKNIVLAHNGTVSVSSIIGKGSTFCIHIPENGKEEDA